MDMKIVSGGVCAAKGFSASGYHCGIRKNRTKKDLALILSRVPASAAAVYTTNLVKGAPLTVTKENLSDGIAQAVICNSGNANTCNDNGLEIARAMCTLAADAVGVKAQDVIVASTGVIGQKLDITPIAAGIGPLAAALSEDGSAAACEAIMTTDTHAKEIAVEFELSGKTCRIGGIAKGSGMIHPNMATMLVFLTTDAAISPEMLKKALSGDIQNTFNMISVDGDTSTNDMVSIMANGLAGNEPVTAPGEDFETFMKALNTVNVYLCRSIAADGEGATKLLECSVTGALDTDTARTVAKSVICSSYQGGHVRRGRQLGPGAVRHRLQRRARGRDEGGRHLPLRGRERHGMRERSGHPLLRGAGREGPPRERDRHPHHSRRRERQRHGLGLRPDL